MTYDPCMHECMGYRVCHLAGVFARHLQEQLQKDSTVVQADPNWKDIWVFDDKEVLCVQLAGLCHDLGI